MAVSEELDRALPWRQMHLVESFSEWKVEAATSTQPVSEERDRVVIPA
jgi:hypothetical protein